MSEQRGHTEIEAEPLELHERVAELLREFGWRSPLDAQWENLKQGLPRLRELLADEEVTRG
jgi:hypothetical protein